MNSNLRHQPTRMTRDVFITAFGDIYEHSPWAAAGAFESGLTLAADSAVGLAGLMAAVVDAADKDVQLALLRAHPDLAGKLALAGALTEDSAREQASAGLDQCTAQELERFRALNARYTEQFGFPFIIAVRGLHRTEILVQFEARVAHTYAAEFQEALGQVHRIAALRLMQRLP
jgi:2-oxo-4-hydroxy-4-carboxy-5-ureidoimidazoline decarboxylase